MGGERLRVGVLGAYGRMGAQACRAIDSAADLELAARVGRGDPRERLVEDDVHVALDLTRPDAVLDNVRFCIDNGISVVVGTSGIDADRCAAIETWLRAQPAVGVLVVPNFALGAVLLQRFAAIAAGYFESVEIVELHHPEKVDAPSGTARRTAELVANARREAGTGAAPDATTDALPGARGAQVHGIPVHAVRLRGLVASQEVLLGNAGETLTLRHDSVDRASFMPGVLLATRRVRALPGLTVGLEHLLADLPHA